MCERIDDIVSALRSFVGDVDPARLDAASAVHLVDTFAAAERLCAAARTLAAGRVSDTRAWRASGQRTAAEWMAVRTGTTLSSAIDTLHTAHRLRELPATRSAFVAGHLSEVQAAEISSASEADASAERGLLSLAARESVAALKEQCRQVCAAAASDEDASERIRMGRYLRNWTDPDGAVRLLARLTPEDGSALLAVVRARADALRSEASRSGQRERAEAYAADALVGLASGASGPRGVVHVEIDHSALMRGRTVSGETSKIRGVGPVPVGVVRRLADAGIVKVLERDGVDIRRVAHVGRTIPAHIRTALEARDARCVVPGCTVETGLEIDHIQPFGQGGETSLGNLARLCRFHHAQKTHHGWRLGGEAGERTWTRLGGDTSRSPPARAP